MRRRVPRRPPAPVRLIPYPAGPGARRAEIRAEGSLALDPGHSPPTGPPGPPRALRSVSRPPALEGPRPAVPGADRAARTAGAGPQARLRAVPAGGAREEPGPPAVAEAITQLVVEVLVGVRPAHQLSRRATPSVCAELAPSAARPPARPGTGTGTGAGRTGRWPATRPRVVSWRVQEPVSGAAEVSAVVLLAGRCHAVALRLELFRGRWLCAAIETTLRPA
ncbi:Rv3235 family protein [Actinomadura scrupuli]|uniref:Rv3235 family protein n=1 Tax=Actinomadura scrupuli TaxID=559629 RepID=UPI003D95F37D